MEVESASSVKLDLVDGLDLKPGEHCMEPAELPHETGTAVPIVAVLALGF